MEKVELNLNLNTILQFRSSDGAVRVALGVWMGRMSLAAFDNSGGRPVCKVLFNYFLTPALRKYIAKVLLDKAPSKISIDTKYFDRTLKKLEYSGSVDIGRDKDGVCFLAIRDKDNKSGVTVYTLVNEALSVNGADIDKVESSELGMKAFDDALAKGVVGELLTSNDTRMAGGGGGNMNSQPSTGEDVPF